MNPSQAEPRRIYWIRLLKCNLVALGVVSVWGALAWWATYLSMIPGGDSSLYDGVRFPLYVPGIFAFICLIFGWPALLHKRKRGKNFQFLTICLTYVLGLFFWSSVADQAEMTQFKQCAERSMVVVNAIKAYESDNKKAPEKLTNVCPRYLKTLPRTGMSRFPDYTYVSGEEALKQFKGNAWTLYIDIPCGMFCDTRLIYLPDETYTELGWFSLSAKMGRWALIHWQE